MIYPERYEELMDACRQITTRRQALAKPRIEALILAEVGPAVGSADLLAHLVSEALLKRIDRQLVESKNIYVQEFDIPQTELFYSMAEAVPFVYAGHSLANQYLLFAAAGLDSFTVLDIGIGNGRQIAGLLRLAAAGKRPPRRVCVIGLDPAESNLGAASGAIEELERELDVKIDFRPVCGMFEELSQEALAELTDAGCGPLLVNSAFSLHHTAHPLNNRERRTELLRGVAALEPLILVLVEPNSDHDTEDLRKRLHHSWEHFGNVFDLVDSASIESSHKFLIKQKFFGREIHDIFGVSDYFRCERHEPYESWMLRMHRAGLRPVEHVAVKADLPAGCAVDVSDGLVRMSFNSVPIVAVLAYSL